MEAYALAKVCSYYYVSFISFKYITDNAVVRNYYPDVTSNGNQYANSQHASANVNAQHANLKRINTNTNEILDALNLFAFSSGALIFW